jgi:hypothetical protein
MKAKEWAAKLLESPEGKDETLKAFVEEIGTVASQRGGSINAVEGAVREQRAKWEAVCRQCPDVAQGMFEEMLANYGADFKKTEETVKAQAAGRAQAGRDGFDRPGRGKKGHGGRGQGQGGGRGQGPGGGRGR